MSLSVDASSTSSGWCAADRKAGDTQQDRSLDSRAVTTQDLEEYERPVAGATSLLGAFTVELADELDTHNGGFRWWTGFSDWKTLTMLSDYLLQSLSGASESLVSASLQAEVHRTASSDEGGGSNSVARSKRGAPRRQTFGRIRQGRSGRWSAAYQHHGAHVSPPAIAPLTGAQHG